MAMGWFALMKLLTPYSARFLVAMPVYYAMASLEAVIAVAFFTRARRWAAVATAFTALFSALFGILRVTGPCGCLGWLWATNPRMLAGVSSAVGLGSCAYLMMGRHHPSGDQLGRHGI